MTLLSVIHLYAYYQGYCRFQILRHLGLLQHSPLDSVSLLLLHAQYFWKSCHPLTSTQKYNRRFSVESLCIQSSTLKMFAFLSLQVKFELTSYTHLTLFIFIFFQCDLMAGAVVNQYKFNFMREWRLSLVTQAVSHAHVVEPL